MTDKRTLILFELLCCRHEIAEHVVRHDRSLRGYASNAKVGHRKRIVTYRTSGIVATSSVFSKMLSQRRVDN